MWGSSKLWPSCPRCPRLRPSEPRPPVSSPRCGLHTGNTKELAAVTVGLEGSRRPPSQLPPTSLSPAAGWYLGGNMGVWGVTIPSRCSPASLRSLFTQGPIWAFGFPLMPHWPAASTGPPLVSGCRRTPLQNTWQLQRTPTKSEEASGHESGNRWARGCCDGTRLRG